MLRFVVGTLRVVSRSRAQPVAVYGLIEGSAAYAAGAVITVGAGGVVLSLLFIAPPRAGLKGVATVLFVLLTAPMVAHVLARTAYRLGEPLAPSTVQDDLTEDGASEPHRASRSMPGHREARIRTGENAQ